MPKAPQPTAQRTLAFGSPATLDELAAHLAAFKDHARLAVALVAQLDTLIDRCTAIPTAEYARWLTGAALYRELRRGTVPHPLAPHVWPYATDLRTVQMDAYPLLIRVRDAYSRLDGASRIAAAQRFGTIHNGGVDFSPVWTVGGWPTQAIGDLDAKAATVKLDIVPLMTINGALWSAHGITDTEVLNQGRARRRRKAGVA